MRVTGAAPRVGVVESVRVQMLRSAPRRIQQVRQKGQMTRMTRRSHWKCSPSLERRCHLDHRGTGRWHVWPGPLVPAFGLCRIAPPEMNPRIVYFQGSQGWLEVILCPVRTVQCKDQELLYSIRAQTEPAIRRDHSQLAECRLNNRVRRCESQAHAQENVHVRQHLWDGPGCCPNLMVANSWSNLPN